MYNENKIYTAPYILLMDSGALGQEAILLHQHNRPNVLHNYLAFHNAKSHQSNLYCYLLACSAAYTPSIFICLCQQPLATRTRLVTAFRKILQQILQNCDIKPELCHAHAINSISFDQSIKRWFFYLLAVISTVFLYVLCVYS